MADNFEQQDVTAIEDMALLGNSEGVKDVLTLFEGYLKNGKQIRLYRKPVNGDQQVVEILKNENDLKAYRKRILGEE